ncbi:MAG: methyltransferase domain-containing protein [Burkholderiaceae bacterium]|nr:methyltransferase domain-containing protein [Burkholderiaceae bacterium]MBT9501029.1 methyltransferase domain-containing protein [Burkholderiaceae bacterium]
MTAIASLDSHKSSYTADFQFYEENRMVHAAYGAKIAEHIDASSAGAVLSLGIGHTEVARAILSRLGTGRFSRYVVVDAAPQIIEDFRASITPLPVGLELVEAYFEDYDSASRFDLIEAGFILEHVDDPGLVLRRLQQLLAPDGRIFIAVPNARSLHRLIGHLSGFLPDMHKLSPADLALGHKRYFDLASLRSLVQDCGYRVIKAEGMLLKPFTTTQLNALNLAPAVWQALLQVSADYPEISNSIYLEVAAS